VTHNVRSDPGNLTPGDQVAGYQIQGRIGRGGMAVVYRALDLRLDRSVALKVLAPELGEDEGFRLRFMRESRAAAGVDHPHIVPVFEAGESAGVLFIAMRYVSGGDVRTLIETEGALSPSRAATITSQVASALDAAHARGLVHRDVKPGNILLGQASNGLDHAYLSDFGLSKHSFASATLTSTGQFLGTLDYVSPEQIQGQPADGRADQYALACTVVEMLTGNPPFRQDDTRALMWAQLEAEPPRLTERRPELPPLVDHVIARAMAKTAAGRYATCRDFATALSAAFAAPPERAVPPAARRSPRPPDMAGEPQPPRSPSQLPAESWPVAAGMAPDDSTIGAGGWAGGAAAGPNDPVPPFASPPEPELARNFLTPGTPDARHWPSQPPLSSGLNGSEMGTWSPPTRPASPGRGRPRRRSGVAVTVAICVAVFVLGVAGAVAYRLANRTDSAASTPPPTHAPTAAPAKSAARQPAAAGPAGVVEAYVRAINEHRYALAWELADKRKPGTLASFEAGFAGTAHDALQILGVQGNVVTARLTATQDDGSIRVFLGTYTVTGGVISNSNVTRTS